MTAVWRHPGLSGTEATALINEARSTPLSQRTILTVLRRLEAKGLLSHVVDGRAFLYTAVVPENEFVDWHAQRAITDLLRRYGADVVISGLAGAPMADPDALARLDELLQRARERQT
jgi:predicted transcriptional regulator